jgi:hypothetical protein
LQRHSAYALSLTTLLAMQKVEGSNPFSRSRKGLHLQVFFVSSVGLCVCVAGGLNADSPPVHH